MSKRLEELSMDLASGMSRRKALWRFLGGAGAAVLAGKAKASGNNVCVAHCKQVEAELRAHANLDVPPDYLGQCVAASAHCPPGHCALLFPTNGGQWVPGACIPA